MPLKTRKETDIDLTELSLGGNSEESLTAQFLERAVNICDFWRSRTILPLGLCLRTGKTQNVFKKTIRLKVIFCTLERWLSS